MFENLMEEVVRKEMSRAPGWRSNATEAQRASTGMTTGQLGEHLRKHWVAICAKLWRAPMCPARLSAWRYPSRTAEHGCWAYRRWWIGWIQQMLLQVLQPIFEPTFSEHSYGFRPGRSAHDAVRAAQRYVQAGKDWVVDMDITKFFDRVNHDILMNRIAKRIRDKRVLGLIGRYLRAGVMVRDCCERAQKERRKADRFRPCWRTSTWMRWTRNWIKRGLAFCRYADDCNIYVGSHTAAERVLESVSQWIKQHLRLEVNASKSGVGRPWERKFLGFRINPQGKIEAAPQSVER